MNRGELAGIMLVALVSAPPSSVWAQSHAQIQTTTKPQIGAVEAQKAQRTPAQTKMASQLLDAIAAAQTGVVNSAAPKLTVGPLPKGPGGVVVDIRASITPELVSAIEANNGLVLSQHPQFGALRASIPLSALETIAGRPDVKSMAPAAKPRTNAGPPFSAEGDIAHTANLVRNDLNATGEGVTVCVISDSLDDGQGALAAAYAQGALDAAKLHVLEDQRGEGSGEGLAMLEIVHAIAPAAQLWFADGFGGAGQMADNIIKLKEKGCQVIIDDVTYPEESPFQDGLISKAVQEVSDAGVLYFSSAGNAGNKKHGASGVWEGDFVDGGPAASKFGGFADGRVALFAPGITLNTVDKVDSNPRVTLYWSDPLMGSGNGYDLFVVDKYGQVIRSSSSSHTGDQDPIQHIPFLRQGESIVVVKESGAQPRYLHLEVEGATLRYSTPGAVRGHNASGADNAFSVAAKSINRDADDKVRIFEGGAAQGVEAFSSDGPRRMFFDPAGTPFTPGDVSSSGGRLIRKPDLTAADGVSTTLPKGGLNPFLGTSAAAPHAGAIAALLLSCEPRPTASQVRAAMRDTALVIEGTTSNDTAGFGLVMARPAATGLCKGKPVAVVPPEGTSSSATGPTPGT